MTWPSVAFEGETWRHCNPDYDPLSGEHQPEHLGYLGCLRHEWKTDPWVSQCQCTAQPPIGPGYWNATDHGYILFRYEVSQTAKHGSVGAARRGCLI